MELKQKEAFNTPHEQYKEYNGLRFIILSEVEDVDEEVKGELLNIRLENGEEIQAWIEEIYEEGSQ